MIKEKVFNAKLVNEYDYPNLSFINGLEFKVMRIITTEIMLHIKNSLQGAN